MKTMLVPVDFTATSENAVSYAVEWCKAYDYKRIILLRTLYDSMFDSLIPSVDYVHVSQDYMVKDREEAMQKLKSMCTELIARVEPDIKVSLAVSEFPLLRSIHEIIEDKKPELVVVGSDNYSYSSESFVAGNAIEIARSSPVRVLIIPSHYQYQPVKQALVPVNFNTISSLNKLHHYQTATPQWKNKKLLVLNVDPKERYLRPDEEFKDAVNALHEYLKDFSHEVYYSNNKNILNGIMDFSRNHETQLIVALPGKHSFLYSLTHKSISEALYRNAKRPVLILK
jgi:nucleotide-binding universal stress UspA family protein